MHESVLLRGLAIYLEITLYNQKCCNKKEIVQCRLRISSMLNIKRRILFQGPHILSNTEIHRNSSHLSIHLNAIIKRPWIISVRICSELSSSPSQMKNLRIRKVNENEVLLFWKEQFTISRWHQHVVFCLFKEITKVNFSLHVFRCTKTYEIFFSPCYWKSKWIHITISKHVPFMSYHFAPDMTKNLTTRGQYKVRAVDVFDRKGKFSLIKSFYWKVYQIFWNLKSNACVCHIFYLSKFLVCRNIFSLSKNSPQW